MTDIVVIAFILIAAVTLDVTAVHFGYDSRDAREPRNDYQLSAPGRMYDS
jgi:hypothetical protein